MTLLKKYGRLEWWVLDWNETAIGFYKRIGAKPMVAEKVPEAILKALPRSIHRLGAHYHGAHKKKSSSG